MNMLAAVLPVRTAPGAAAWRRAGVLLVVAAAALGALQGGVPPLRVAVLLLVAPLAEEAVLRLGVHEPLLRRGVTPLAAIALSALLFALAHALLRGDPLALAVVLPALLVGVRYQHTRRLRDAVLLHALFNACWMAVALAGLPTRLLR